MGTFLLHLVVFFQHLAVVPYQLAMVLQRSDIFSFIMTVLLPMFKWFLHHVTSLL